MPCRAALHDDQSIMTKAAPPARRFVYVGAEAVMAIDAQPLAYPAIMGLVCSGGTVSAPLRRRRRGVIVPRL